MANCWKIIVFSLISNLYGAIKNLEPGIELHLNRDQKKQVSVPSSVVLDMRLLGDLVNYIISSKNNSLQKL